MASHVTQGAGSEFPPAAPGKRGYVFIVIHPPGRAYPLLPVQPFRYGLFLRRPGKSLRPYGSIGPGVHFPNLADDAGANQFDATTHVIVGMGLVAHLGFHPRLLRYLGHHACFPDAVSEGLLAINMLAGPHGHYRSVKVMVVGCRNRDRIDLVAQLGKHFPIIRPEGEIRICLANFHHRPQPALVPRRRRKFGSIHHVDQTDDVETGLFTFSDVGTALAPGSDTDQSWFGQVSPGPTGYELKAKRRGGGRCGNFPELAPGNLGGRNRIFHEFDYSGAKEFFEPKNPAKSKKIHLSFPFDHDQDHDHD